MSRKYTFQEVNKAENKYVKIKTIRLKTVTRNGMLDINEIKKFYKDMIKDGLQPNKILITGLAGQFYTLKGWSDAEPGYGDEYMSDKSRSDFHDKFYYVDFTIKTY